MGDLSRSSFDGVSGSQQFIDDIPGVTWTSALTNAQLTGVHYVSVSSAVLISAGTSGSSPARIVAQGWEPSPHQTSGGAEAYVRWDSESHGWAKLGVLGSAATETFSIAINSVGQIAYERRVSGSFSTAIVGTFSVTANTWYKIALEWDAPTSSDSNNGRLFLKLNDAEIAELSGLDTFADISLGQLQNIGTSGRVYFDNWRLYPGVNVSAINQDVDEAEFDWETQSVGVSYIISGTVFTDDIYAVRCRVVDVPECRRRIGVNAACRKVWVSPVVLH